jgi:hypothetical protein
MKFKIIYKDKVQDFRANDWQSFEAEAWSIYLWVLDNPSQEKEYQFIVSGKVVSLQDAQMLANKARKEFEANRATTHKQITKRKEGTQGNFKNNFETVWVKIY